MQPDKIELGLERIRRVAVAAQLAKPDFKIITVAGTNGKGSTVAYLNAMLNQCGYTTGVYTSPHFIDFNERIVVRGERVADQALCDAFEAIDGVRNDTALTYFEFTTLAAIHCFSKAAVDVAILEVGLGGRLDAVNAWDCDIACISSIAIDHIDWLGDDRETIGREKAGVARSGKLLVCGDTDPPHSVAIVAAECGADLLQRNRDFHVETAADGSWLYRDAANTFTLPPPAITGQWARDNAAVAICAASHFMNGGVTPGVIETALRSVLMTGRMQMLKVSGIQVILDVAHNRAAAESLAKYLAATPVEGSTRAVFGCMQDKDLASIVDSLAPRIDYWCLAEIDYPRAMPAADIQRELLAKLSNKPNINGSQTNSPITPYSRSSVQPAKIFTSVIHAIEVAVAQSTQQDRIVVFGSFHVVGPALSVLQAN